MDEGREVVRVVSRALGGDVVGCYLYGSSVLGGLRPASDVDVLVVTRGRMDERQRRELLDGLRAVSGTRDGVRPVEVTVVVRSDVRPWRYPPTADFLHGEWLREEYEAGLVPRRTPMPDLALTITMALSGDRALTGPAPARVLDQVPHADLVRASVEGLPDLLDELATDTRNVLLTLARVWYTLGTGRIARKDTAADWALARLPPELRPALEHARRLYLESGYAQESWSEELRAGVRPLATRVLAEIDRLRPPGHPPARGASRTNAASSSADSGVRR